MQVFCEQTTDATRVSMAQCTGDIKYIHGRRLGGLHGDQEINYWWVCDIVRAHFEGLLQKPGIHSPNVVWRTRILPSFERIRGDVRHGGFAGGFGIQRVGVGLGRRQRGIRNHQPQGVGQDQAH